MSDKNSNPNNIRNYSECVISIQNITKTFGDFHALDGLTLEIDKGMIYGLIGPNGAGKTTAINILLGLIDFDKNISGSKITIFNHPVPKEINKIYSRIGYMPQDLSIYEDISVKQNLEFFGKLQGMSKKELADRIPHVLKLVDLHEFGNRAIKDCSGGMKRRASLAVALLHNPELLLLDEPTVGIDPELRIEFWQYFRKMAKEGVTILITTHYLAESVNCDIVGLINKRIIESGSPAELQKQVMKLEKMDELPSMEQVFIHYAKNKMGNLDNDASSKMDSGSLNNQEKNAEALN